MHCLQRLGAANEDSNMSAASSRIPTPPELHIIGSSHKEKDQEKEEEHKLRRRIEERIKNKNDEEKENDGDMFSENYQVKVCHVLYCLINSFTCS